MTDSQWEAIQTNDAAFDGRFVYGLRTTHIFCRPSCPARACQKEHVVIFASAKEAMAQGYRPCLRCCPDRPEWKGARNELAERARVMIEQSSAEKFSLSELAGRLFVNESYLLRTFHAVFGCTPLSYHNTCRCRKACELLARRDLSVTEICYRVGFVSAPHFSRVFAQIMGQTPTAYRRSLEKNRISGAGTDLKVNFG